MNRRHLQVAAMLTGGFFSCKKEKETTVPAAPVADQQYDNKINTDGFSLVHDEHDHLLLLPGVQLQKNNPRKETYTGDGLNYTIDLTYTYNDKNLPLTKTGDVLLTNGPNAGQHFTTNAIFTYY